MELLNDFLSPLDNLEFICEDHGIPCEGLCSNPFCNNKTKFFCMKCIKSGITCITKEKHELITLSEFLFRFFKSENNIKSEIQEILKMNSIISEYDKNELNSLKSDFKSIKEEKNIKIIENKLYEMINYFIVTFKSKNKLKLDKLKERSKSHKKYEKDINNLLNIRMPDIDKNLIDNDKKLKEVIKKGFSLSTPKNFVNSVKLLNNKNKLTEISMRLNKKIYVNNVYSNISTINDNRKKLENKINKILDDLEKKFDKKLELIENSIIIPKNDKLYSSYNSSIVKFSSNPNNLKYKGDICNTAHKSNSIDKVFCAFKSYSNESFIIWGTTIYSIEFFDLEKNKIINTIKNAHINTIYTCRHYPDKKNKLDYLITSSYDRNVKIWNVKDFTSKLIIFNAHTSNYIYSACILFEESENKNYIITACPSDFIKIWDFSSKFVDRIGHMDENTYFVDTYFDNKNKKNYILNGNYCDVKSYDFKTREEYKRYKGTPQSWHMSAIVYDSNEQQILIESDGNGYIRMWEFHKANLIKSFFTNYLVNLRGICLWNEKYLFAGGSDHQIKLFDLINGKYVKFYKEHNSSVCTLDKIKSSKFGECLVSQGLDGKIKIWSAN